MLFSKTSLSLFSHVYNGKEHVNRRFSLKFRQVFHSVKTTSCSILVCFNKDSSILGPYVLPFQFLSFLVYFTKEFRREWFWNEYIFCGRQIKIRRIFYFLVSQLPQLLKNLFRLSLPVNFTIIFVGASALYEGIWWAVYISSFVIGTSIALPMEMGIFSHVHSPLGFIPEISRQSAYVLR